ncbi:MAG: hypothetical protein LUD01_04360 [Clostridiales bacterium]|nr:hypothetical protein [Clostridiales bacterium]
MFRYRKIRMVILLTAALLFALPALAGCKMEEKITGPVSEFLSDELFSEASSEDEPEIEKISDERYAYQTLDDEAQAVYDEIVYALMNREEERQVSTVDVDVIGLAYQAVRYDYCNFFWVDQLAYVMNSKNDEIVSISITPSYTVTAEEQAVLQEQIDAEAARMLADAPLEGSDYDKALYVYETLIREVDYVVDAENNQNIISVFVNHETICQGYAYATQYLLELLDIPCTTVTGIANGESHAWNLVLLDGEYYYIDTTWGNANYIYLAENEGNSEAGEVVGSDYQYLNYDYFGVTTDMLLTTHTPDSEIPLPECTATADNYYIHEGLYVETWDADRIGSLIREGYESGEAVVRIRFANTELCEQAQQYFLEDGKVFDYCDGLQTAQYLENTDSEVLVILFPT